MESFIIPLQYHCHVGVCWSFAEEQVSQHPTSRMSHMAECIWTLVVAKTNTTIFAHNVLCDWGLRSNNNSFHPKQPTILYAANPPPYCRYRYTNAATRYRTHEGDKKTRPPCFGIFGVCYSTLDISFDPRLGCGDTLLSQQVLRRTPKSIFRWVSLAHPDCVIITRSVILSSYVTPGRTDERWTMRIAQNAVDRERERNGLYDTLRQ